ncbi:MAG TPA: archaellin/type IV pilin N-terminal domain-containing protein [Candidatus Nanoarchaeia archaeon]|nr:archaellin/type IV pilin N-terminal domain-containing protein [Candidatus Nanoarchaeia archaeon]
MKGKRGLSPVIATVLLIAIVIVIGLIVFLWFRGITEEAITKFDGRNIKLFCDEVKMEAEYSGGYVYISNSGNVPIYRVKAKITSDGSYSTEILEENWPETGLLQGGTYAGQVDSGDELLLIPVLVGETAEEKKEAYTCEERHGVYASIN